MRYGPQRSPPPPPSSSYTYLVAEEHALEHGARRDDSRLGSGREPQQVQLSTSERKITHKQARKTSRDGCTRESVGLTRNAKQFPKRVYMNVRSARSSAQYAYAKVLR